MENRKVLIIGGNGFIGKNLCSKFLKESYEVYSLDITKPDKLRSKINYIVGDFFDDDFLYKCLEGMNLIIHSLSTINPGNSNEKYMQGYSKDLLQSIKLFSWVVKKKTKLIFLSSGGTVYGDQKKQPIDETRLAVPINHYGTVKLCIENVMRTFNTQAHCNMLIARISNPYGPGQDYTKGVGFIDAAIKKALNGESIEVWGDGDTIRDYIYIDDVCDMIFTLSKYDGKEEIFNISSGKGLSLNEILREIRNLNLNINVRYTPSRNVDVKSIVLDNKKIREIHNENLISISKGLEDYFNYLKAFKNP